MNVSSLFSGHPGDAVLRRFADGVSSEAERVRVSAHLAGCTDCRADVAFARDVRATARTLPEIDAPKGMLERIVGERSAGERIILPVEEPVVVSGARTRRAMSIAVVLIVVAAIFLFPRNGARRVATSDSGRVDRSAIEDPESPVSAFAGMFAPSVALAQPPGDDRMAPPLANLDGTRLRAGRFTLTRSVTDKGASTVVARSLISLDSVSYDGRAAWRVVQLTTGAATEAETVLVERKSLRPIGRVERVRPYVSYAEIVIRQRFNGDSVQGWMHTDRTFGRPISRRLDPKFGWYIPSEALAPFLLEGATLSRDWKASVAFVGWAVRSNDVFYRFNMTVVGEEKITVPQGSFDCWRIKMESGGKQIDYWVRKSDGLGIRTHRVDANGRIVDVILGEAR